jgi:putative ABC transport system substrate-binding protein
MSRVLLIVLTLLLTLLSSAPAQGQRPYRIGALASDEPFVPALFDGFKKKMAELGYVEGKNVQYDFHNAKGGRDSLPVLAQKLIEEKPDVIVTSSTTATLPVANLTAGSDLSVVFLSSGNPLQLVKGYASSGNNLTGISTAVLDLTAKRVELLKEIAPGVRRVASFNNPQGVNYRKYLAELREAAKKLHVTVWEIDVRNKEEIEQAVTALTRKVADGILLQPDRLVAQDHFEIIVRRSIEEKLPLIPSPGVNLETGGLVTYGQDSLAMGQQAALLVDKVLRGSRPRDLPIEQPMKLKLVVSLRTARAIGLKIPKEILLRADEIVE